MQKEFAKNLKNLNFLMVLVSFLVMTSCKEGLPGDAADCVEPDMQHLMKLKQGQDQPAAEDPTVCRAPVDDNADDGSDGSIGDNPADEPIDDDVDEPVDLPEEPSAAFTINYVLRDFSKSKRAKMDDAIEKLKLVVNSIEFKEAVLAHTYNGVYQYVDNLGLSNSQIYEKIMAGAETLNPAIDEEMDIDITLYFTNNSVVGYTYPNSERIWVNDKFFTSNSLGQVAANIMHEWTHKIGFGHDYNRTARRPYSVPYAVGSIVRRLVDNL
ncbi:MAG: hypothetical protein CME62_09270 [Halobacteriovoraceae bacterium]|nr:hypothetical protein [Halobacteriovoraceae bacterium]|tara:strand:- start:2292 stop:3095 length:804 start_codon:yes stop_codon:yes gene_type:complete